MTEELDFMRRVLTVFAFEFTEQLWWRVDNGEVKFFAQCSDVFAWGCADLEEILPADLEALETAAADARTVVDGECYVAELYSARRRGMRPQGAVYKNLPEAMWPMFDACGPERATGLGNPLRRPTPSGGTAPTPQEGPVIQIPPPIPGPGGCTAGWNDDPCPGEAEPGCEIDGYPTCRECFDDHCSNACDSDPLVEET